MMRKEAVPAPSAPAPSTPPTQLLSRTPNSPIKCVRADTIELDWDDDSTTDAFDDVVRAMGPALMALRPEGKGPLSIAVEPVRIDGSSTSEIAFIVGVGRPDIFEEPLNEFLFDHPPPLRVVLVATTSPQDTASDDSCVMLLRYSIGI
jgi:hypothetical protein